MLKIFNDLEPFFKNCYRRINVREYARIRSISPPSASKLLHSFSKGGLLLKEAERNYIYFVANKESRLFIGLSKIYWNIMFEKVGLIDYFQKELVKPLVILYGSFSKAEISSNSDIDIAVFTQTKKELNLVEFEKKLKRKIQIILFSDKKEVKNKYLLNNILNGFILIGSW